MGVAYSSSSSISIEDSSSVTPSRPTSKQASSRPTSRQTTDKPASKVDERDILRGLRLTKIKNLVCVYCEQYIPPILDRVDLTFLIKNAIDSPGVEDEIVESVITIFSEKSLCRTYEVISVMILLCDADWKTRLDLLFDLFKCAGTEEIYHEDIRMAVQSISVGLCKVWKQPRWTSEELYKLSENLANHAFMKAEKDMDETLKRNEFNSWAFERLKESHTIAGWDGLKAILESSHVPTTSVPSTPRVDGVREGIIGSTGELGSGILGENDELRVIDVNNDGEDEIPLHRGDNDHDFGKTENLQHFGDNEDKTPLFLDETVGVDEILTTKKEKEIDDVLYLEKAAEDLTDMLGGMDIKIDDDDNDDDDRGGSNSGKDNNDDNVDNDNSNDNNKDSNCVAVANTLHDSDSKENNTSTMLDEDVAFKCKESENKTKEGNSGNIQSSDIPKEEMLQQADGIREGVNDIEEGAEAMDEFRVGHDLSALPVSDQRGSISGGEVVDSGARTGAGDDDSTSVISDITAVTRAAPLTSIG